jgi:hypothetical protein
MPQNLADDGAVLVHPAKAFVLRHIPVPERYEGDRWNDAKGMYTYASSSMGAYNTWPDALGDVAEYCQRVHASVETLFGAIDFDMHHARDYPECKLEFHRDVEEYLDGDVLRMVTCVHNATDDPRPLTFARPTWTKHTETFSLTIPPRAILAFGGSLITDYEHGIPSDPSVVNYRSIVTRFATYDTGVV